MRSSVRYVRRPSLATQHAPPPGIPGAQACDSGVLFRLKLLRAARRLRWDRIMQRVAAKSGPGGHHRCDAWATGEDCDRAVSWIEQPRRGRSSGPSGNSFLCCSYQSTVSDSLSIGCYVLVVEGYSSNERSYSVSSSCSGVVAATVAPACASLLRRRSGSVAALRSWHVERP